MAHHRQGAAGCVRRAAAIESVLAKTGPPGVGRIMLELKDSSLLKARCLIDDQWIGASDGECIDVDDPASGRLVGRVPRLSAAQIDQAIALANATEYGLAAYSFSRDVGRTFRVAEALEFGMVGSNTGVMSDELAPFGGVKQSGIGREGSRYGIEGYLEMKYLCLAGIDR